jgi:hypothetical protein
MAKPKKRESAELSKRQLEIVCKFNDHSFENPDLTFEEVVKKEFKGKLFPPTPQGRLFEKECREVFDRERKTATPNDSVDVKS